MKNTVKIIIIVLISLGAGIFAHKNLFSRYFMEEYYFAENLAPNNEKNTEQFREKIQQLIQKTIPAKDRPNSDQYQCFKIISEAVFFCSVETQRKHVAQSMQSFLEETIPEEIGWLPEEEANEKAQAIKDEIASSSSLIHDMTDQLEKIKKKGLAQQGQRKKFSKTNELYKKNLSLLQRKIDLLQSLITEAPDDASRSDHQSTLDRTQNMLDSIQQDYASFREKNMGLAEFDEQVDVLNTEIANLKEKNSKDQEQLDLAEKALNAPNEIGMIADPNQFQLVSDPARQKFDAQRNPTYILWFGILTFFLLTNFIFRLQPRVLVPFQEDATMTMGL